MKNLQVIDGALNCSYSIFSVGDEDFSLIFPALGQDVEFVEDLTQRLGERASGALVLRATSRCVEKTHVKGIHGTLFFGLPDRKKFYPTKRESDFDNPANLAIFLQNEPSKRVRSKNPKHKQMKR